MNIKVMLVCASIFAGMAVVLGAFGAHALKATLTETSLATYETAVKYQMWHSFALLAVALISLHIPQPQFRWAAVLFVLGIVLFSGSLYALALGAPRWVGPITPLGGMCFMGAWLLVLVGAVKAEL